jgi:hypothetical protein
VIRSRARYVSRLSAAFQDLLDFRPLRPKKARRILLVPAGSLRRRVRRTMKLSN